MSSLSPLWALGSQSSSGEQGQISTYLISWRTPAASGGFCPGGALGFHQETTNNWAEKARKRFIRLLLFFEEDKMQGCFENCRVKYRKLYILAMRVQSVSNDYFSFPMLLTKGDRRNAQRLRESRWLYQQGNQPALQPITSTKSLATAPCKYSGDTSMESFMSEAGIHFPGISVHAVHVQKGFSSWRGFPWLLRHPENR